MATISELEKSVQAILFAAGDPYEKERLTKLLGINRETLDQVVQRVNDLYQQTAFVILDLDQSYQMVTREEYAAVIREALEVKNNTPLSQAALEVLAIIAYNQPVSRGFVEQVRGVDSSSRCRQQLGGQFSGCKGAGAGDGTAGNPRQADLLRDNRALPALLWDAEHRDAAQDPPAAGAACSTGRSLGRTKGNTKGRRKAG